MESLPRHPFAASGFLGSRGSSFSERHQRRLLLSRYRLHLQRLRRATSLVDRRPPLLSTRTLGGLDALPHDARAFLERTNENVRLLLSLSRIKRSGGTLGSLEEPPLRSRHRPRFRSALPRMLNGLDSLQQQNLLLGHRLARIRARSRLPAQWEWPGRQSQTSGGRCPSLVATSTRSALAESGAFQKYEGCDLQLPADYSELVRLLRPRVVLHFGLVDGRPLGQVVVQLYTEAAPLVVLQFVRTCLGHRAHEFAVRRIFPCLWLEGYLLPAEEPAEGGACCLGEPMEFDGRVLGHERFGCVLSCAKEYCVHGFPGGAINFSISFKPLQAANGQRVAFGRVVRGDKVIECMEAHGTKNGKISRPLLVTHCDVVY
ncbi:uncharacterized protein LOC108092868 [Drosophila ficusphila]|uniref:uncharacterized protein LOC108092868 n=1 Tax=Drosophila ficusphila TaxID=30025 RepID=UPI0007E8084D|nr:uncharacterized protein LOC108092868 [Drosophila ficusphila]